MMLSFLAPVFVSTTSNWTHREIDKLKPRCFNNNQNQKGPYDAWEVKNDDVTITEELGQGAFGKVYKGTIKIPSLKKKSLKSTTAVAVKMLQGELQRVME